MEFSEKGKKLIEMYTKMADHGYLKTDGVEVKDAFSDFEMRFYRGAVKSVMMTCPHSPYQSKFQKSGVARLTDSFVRLAGMP